MCFIFKKKNITASVTPFAVAKDETAVIQEKKKCQQFNFNLQNALKCETHSYIPISHAASSLIFDKIITQIHGQI